MWNRFGPGGAVFLAVLVVAVGTAVAGEHGKCTKSAEECAALIKEKYQTRGWLGVDLDPNEDGSLRVTSVVPDSPAQRAGLKIDDILVSVNGTALSKDTTEKVMMKGEDWKIGAALVLGVRRSEDVSTVRATLARIPDTLLAKMIETHAKQHHDIATN